MYSKALILGKSSQYRLRANAIRPYTGRCWIVGAQRLRPKVVNSNYFSLYSGCAIHVGQQIPYLIALCPFSMYQTDAISAVK
jgi:hypothetical protein